MGCIDVKARGELMWKDGWSFRYRARRSDQRGLPWLSHMADIEMRVKSLWKRYFLDFMLVFSRSSSYMPEVRMHCVGVPPDWTVC